MMSKSASSGLRTRVPALIGTVLAVTACQAAPKRPADATKLGPFTTMVVSQPATDSVSRACFKGAGHAAIREYEPSAAANPANPDQIVATWMANTDSSYQTMVATSGDGGATWTVPTVVSATACAGGAAAAKGSGDDWAAFGPDGRAYVSTMALDLGTPGHNALVVSTSTDTGRTWSPSRIAAPSNTPTFNYDNLELTADPTRPGAVYLATTQYQSAVPGKPADTKNPQSFAGPAAFTRSTDGGQTWTEIRPVTPLIGGGRISAPLVLVDPRTKKLHMVYFREHGDSALVGVITSEDQGDHWSAERLVAPFVRLTDYPSTTIKFGGKFGITTAQDILQGAIDPESGRIFVAFADARHTQGKFLSVSLTSSADGITWTQPVEVNPTMAAHAWLPSVAIDSAGRLGVSYLDVRTWSADTTKEVIPTNHTLGVYPLGPDGTPGARADYQLDTFNLLGPKGGRGGTGDYQALVGRRQGFASFYVKHYPAGSPKVSDFMVAR